MKNKGNQKDVIITNNDNELIEVSSKFLKSIENEFKKYNNEYKNKIKKNKGYIMQKDYYYIAESITKKSPLTIMNAPWGSGKTFFIENLMKLLIDNKIKSNIFAKAIIIDAWKFSNSKDVPLEFISELSNILLKINGDALESNNKTKFFNKMMNMLAPTSLSISLNIPIVSLKMSKNLSPDDKKIGKAINNITENKNPTLLFIDNLERLGSLSWDLLKSIIRLQEFENYLIVLPLNINKIKNNEYSPKNNEYPIEKYIDIKMYNFKQDYYGYFYDSLKDDFKSSLFNSIFSEEINGEKLSIREVHQSIISNDVLKLPTIYSMIKVIYNKIWSARKIVETILKEHVRSFLEYNKKKEEIIKSIYNNIIIKDNRNNLLNFEIDFEIVSNNIIDFSNMGFYYHDTSYNYVSDMKKINKLINNKNTFLKRNINDWELQIKSLRSKVKKCEKGIKIQNLNIEKYTNSIKLEKAKNSDKKNPEVITINNENIFNANKIIDDDKKIILDSKNRENSINSEILFQNDVKNSLFLEIPQLINNYKKIDKEIKNKFGEEEIKDIIKYLKSIPEINKLFYESIDGIMNLSAPKIISILS